MRNRFASYVTSLFTLAAMTAIGLGCSVLTSRADISDLLRDSKASRVTSPRQVLPPISNPRPYRQVLYVQCNRNTPVYGSSSCLLAFDVVPASRVLQIDNINCTGGSGGFVLFDTQVTLEQVVGFVLGGTASGPYYFQAGEKPRLATAGNSPTDSAICAMYGTLWQTN